LPELGAYFCPDSKGLVASLIAAEQRLGFTGVVGKPFAAAPPDAIQPVGWPGEGTYFWWYGALLDGNYITGPYGLITADLDTTGMVDYKLMRREAKSAVKTVLQLASTSAQDLQSPVG
jgi:hypothetical protein